MIHPLPASPGQTGLTEQPLPIEGASLRSLTAETRLMLSEFRLATRTATSALLLHDREHQLLRLLWRVPALSRHTAVHPLSTACALSHPFTADGPATNGSWRVPSNARCDTCRSLFGGEVALAVIIPLGGTQQAVVAAFGPSGSLLPREKAAARRIGHRLAIHITSYLSVHQAQQRAAKLARVNEIASTLASIVEEKSLFPSILDGIASVVPYDTATLYVFDPAEQRLRVGAVCGFSSDQQHWLEDTADERMPGIVFGSQRSVAVEDAWSDSQVQSIQSQISRVTKTRAAYWAPMQYRGQPLGVIGLGSTRPGAFGDEARELISCLANQAAVAIAMARLHRKAVVGKSAEPQDLASVRKIGQAIGETVQTEAVLQDILLAATETLQPSRGTIGLLDHQSDELVVVADSGFGPKQVGQRVPLNGTASGWIIRNGRSLLVSDVSDSEFDRLSSWHEQGTGESFIGVPLKVSGTTFGVLTVFSPRGQRFQEKDVVLLEELAGKAAVAIERANLFELAVREKARLEAIVESLHEGLVLAKPDGAIVYVSQRFINLLAVDPRVLSGATISRVWDWLASRCTTPAQARQKLNAVQGDASQPIVVSLSESCQQDLEVQSFAVQGTTGELLGRVYLIRDVTRRAEVDRLKASMLSTVSHELRTPLAAIKGFATSLLRDDVTWDEASKRDFIVQIDREVDRLSALVRNILDMSRLDTAMLRLDREWCNVSELVEEMLQRMAPVVGDHRIEQFIEDRKILGLVDKRYLERVIWNLVENAAKYSPRGTTITLSLSRSGGEIAFVVQDRGAGIPPEEQRRVFDAFYRVAGTRTQGVGLGLAICKGIVEAHGGTIALDSTVGKGSTFMVRLPEQPAGTAAGGQTRPGSGDGEAASPLPRPDRRDAGFMDR